MKRLLSLLLTAMLVFLVPFSALAEEPLLRLTVMAAGESDCMLLESGGEAMLVDGGSNKYRERLVKMLESRGLTRLKNLYNPIPMTTTSTACTGRCCRGSPPKRF